MRMMTLFLGVILLGGCAAPSTPRPGSSSGEKASLLQRLGLGRPIGQKRPSTGTASIAMDSHISTTPVALESGPTITVEPEVSQTDNDRTRAEAKPETQAP